MLFPDGCRLTLNRPAAVALGNPPAVAVDISDDAAALLPTEIGFFAPPIFERDRGGIGFWLTAEMFLRLRQQFELTPEQPYLLLTPMADQPGLKVASYGRAGVPARHLLVARMWFSADAKETIRHDEFEEVDSHLPKADDIPFASVIRRAHLLVRRAAHQVGRPSAEVVEARRLMQGFDELVREVRPELIVDHHKLESDLRAAIAAIERGISRMEGRAVKMEVELPVS